MTSFDPPEPDWTNDTDTDEPYIEEDILMRCIECDGLHRHHPATDKDTNE